MPVPRWVTRLFSTADRRRRKHARAAQRALRQDRNVRLQLVRLEERRVLNADFSLIGDQLQLTNFDGNSEKLIVQQAGAEYQFVLARQAGPESGGNWQDISGSGISPVDNVLSVPKSAVASILIDDSAAAGDLVVEFQSVDLADLSNALVAQSVDAVTQAPSTSLIAPRLQLVANSVDLANNGNDFDQFQGTINGSISLADKDDLTIGGISAGGPISVLTAGPITVAGQVNALNSQSVSMLASTGDLAIHADVLSTAAASGNLGDGSGIITLEALTGNITTNGTGTIRASGPAGRAELTSGGDIGASEPLSTAVSQLTATAGGSSGIRISNTGDLLATMRADSGTARLNVTGRLESINPGSDWSANAFDIDATGDIRITRNVIADAEGGIDLQSSDGEIAIELASGLLKTTDSAATITLTAKDIDLGGSPPVRIDAAGDVRMAPIDPTSTITLGGSTGVGFLLTESNLAQGVRAGGIVTIGAGTGLVRLNDANLTSGDYDLTVVGGDIRIQHAVLADGRLLTLRSSGRITDENDVGVQTPNVTIGGSGRLLIYASDGIGTTDNPIETSVAQLDANNVGSGGAHLVNNGALTLTDLDGAVPAVVQGGGQIQASSPLWINTPQVVSGAFQFIAGDDLSTPGDNLTVSANIIHDGNGVLTLQAGDDIHLAAGSVTSSGGAANEVHLIADHEADGSDGDRGGIQQDGGMLRTGTMFLRAYETVQLTQPGNDIDTLSAQLDGSLHFVDQDNLVIGDAAAAGSSGVTTSDDDVRIETGTTLDIDAAVVLGRGDLSLSAGGAVNQTAAVTGGGLQLTGAGPFTLTDSGNAFATLAAQTSGTIDYWDADALQIGAVDVLGHAVSGVTTSAGTVSVSAEGNLNVTESIMNTGGGGTTLISGTDLTIAAPVESSLAGSTAGGGSIELIATGNVLIRENVTTTGGVFRGPDAETGRILVDAGGSIDLQPGVLIATGTGRMMGYAGVNGSGDPVQTPPVIEVRLVPVDQGGSNVDVLGHAIIEVTVYDQYPMVVEPSVQNYQIEVDWADGFDIANKLSTYRPDPSYGGGNDFISGTTYRFDHYYIGNPDVENPADPIPIQVTIRYDGRSLNNRTPVNGIVFREAGRELSTSVQDELTVPGTGLFAFIKVVKSEIVPVEFRQSAPTFYVVVEAAAAARQEEVYAVRSAVVDETSITSMRIFFRRVDAAGKEGEDIELPPDALERGLDEVFRKFPNGQYRVYLQEPNSRRIRLIREIHVYQGRIVPADFREGVMERQPGGSPSEVQEKNPAAAPEAEPSGSSGTSESAAAVAAWVARRRRIEQVDRALERAGGRDAAAGWLRRSEKSREQT